MATCITEHPCIEAQEAELRSCGWTKKVGATLDHQPIWKSPDGRLFGLKTAVKLVRILKGRS